MTGCYLAILVSIIFEVQPQLTVKRLHSHVTRSMQRSGCAAWSRCGGSWPCWPIIALLLCHPCLKGERSWIIHHSSSWSVAGDHEFFTFLHPHYRSLNYFSSQKIAVKEDGIMMQRWKKVSASPDIGFPLAQVDFVTTVNSLARRHCGAIAAGDY